MTLRTIADAVDMAIRLSKAFGNDPDFWMRLQRNYDLAQALKNADKIHVRKLTPDMEPV